MGCCVAVQHTVLWHHRYLMMLIAAGDVMWVSSRVGGLEAKRSSDE